MSLTDNGNGARGKTSAIATARARAKPTILIAEDDTDSREMMQLLLELKGYQVVSAVDGQQALHLARKNLPDLVLIDLELPKLDGLSVTRTLKLESRSKNVRVIIISGHDPSKYRSEALAAGCDDYLLKPINLDQLEKLLPPPTSIARFPSLVLKTKKERRIHSG